MEQSKIIDILNRHIFNEEKASLIQAIADRPDRFIGLFRSTTPRLKLLQNILQSREIRFGDAMEEVIAALLTEMGFVNLPKKLIVEEDNELACDQYFATPDRSRFYLLEQKVRDDHDSTKKRGQIANFRNKIAYLKTQHGDSLVSIMYFLDPSLHKNETYYQQQIKLLQEELQVEIRLFYNGELFEHFEGHTRTWEQILDSLQAWRNTTPENISLNYDAEPDRTLVELSSIPPAIWHKIVANDSLWKGGVVQALFPSGATLRLLYESFKIKGLESYRIGRTTSTYRVLADSLEHRLNQYFSDKDRT